MYLKCQDTAEAARRLAMKVIGLSAGQLEAGIKQLLVSSMSGDGGHLKPQIDYHEIIYDIYSCAPQVLSGVVPYLTGELLVITLTFSYPSIYLWNWQRGYDIFWPSVLYLVESVHIL